MSFLFWKYFKSATAENEKEIVLSFTIEKEKLNDLFASVNMGEFQRAFTTSVANSLAWEIVGREKEKLTDDLKLDLDVSEVRKLVLEKVNKQMAEPERIEGIVESTLWSAREKIKENLDYAEINKIIMATLNKELAETFLNGRRR